MLPYIPPGASPRSFPPVEYALDEPNGLLAAGGDLTVERLRTAYSQGIFPWYSEGQPILWWSPDPRTVFQVGHLRISRRFSRTLRQHPYRISFNRAFRQVIQGCAEPRGDGEGTWLVPEMQRAYLALHEAGFAESVEVWDGDQLVGGLYGVPMGRVFCAESMFSRVSDASKIALVHLDRRLMQAGFIFIDAQVGSDHLYRMGAMDVSRTELVRHLGEQR